MNEQITIGKADHIDNLARGVLGALIISPALLEACDLRDVDFPAGHFRETFSAIAAVWEEARPAEIDSRVLAVRIGDNGAGTFIASLLDGNIKVDEPTFRGRVSELRKRALTSRVLAKIEGQARAGELDLDEVREDLTRYDELEFEAESAGGPNFVSRKAHGIQTRRVGWLWPGVVPNGMPTALEGDPGVGKTFVAADIAARVTRGTGFPTYGEGDWTGPAQGSVVYISSEGVPDRILVPRLVAAGADLERVEIVEGICSKRGEFEILDVNQHLPALARRMKNDPSTKLLVIDPLASHLSPKLNMNSSLEMRAAMDCVARFAEEVSCAVLVVMHLNKDDRKAAIHRAAGSGQIMAAVKSAWAVVKKPDDENDNRRYFGPVKSNLSPFRRSLAFEIQDTAILFSDGTKGNIGRVVWSHEPEDFDLQAAISPGAFELHSKVGAAVTFLRERLTSGKRYATDLIDEAQAQGITKDNLWKAKRKESIEDGREGFGGKSVWFYRADQEAGIQ